MGFKGHPRDHTQTSLLIIRSITNCLARVVRRTCTDLLWTCAITCAALFCAELRGAVLRGLGRTGLKITHRISVQPIRLYTKLECPGSNVSGTCRCMKCASYSSFLSTVTQKHRRTLICINPIGSKCVFQSTTVPDNTFRADCCPTAFAWIPIPSSNNIPVSWQFLST